MTQHTPGPWTVKEDRLRLAIMAPEPFLRGNSYPERSTDTVTYIHTGTEKTPLDKANARLIAAAPEMYEALKRLVGGHSRDCARNNCPRCEAGNLLTKINHP